MDEETEAQEGNMIHVQSGHGRVQSLSQQPAFSHPHAHYENIKSCYEATTHSLWSNIFSQLTSVHD